jgi:hypothetical protein
VLFLKLYLMNKKERGRTRDETKTLLVINCGEMSKAVALAVANHFYLKRLKAPKIRSNIITFMRCGI